MALRVLLADESVTIKKVIQLALQDFAVEVKAVPVGLDVLEVSKSFQPDLVFADILLQKRSGYEVCSDLKKDPTTAAIPVILMWSSFMELDQRQVDACGADGKLEKPFEVEALRKLVLELVPRTRSQRLAHFLEYPPTLAAPLRGEAKAAETPAVPQMPQSKPAVPKPVEAASPRPAPPLGGLSLDNTASGITPTDFGAPAKPKMPPPLKTSMNSSAPKPAPPSNPFSPNFDATPTPRPKPKTPPPADAKGPSTGLTPTPGIPDRPEPAVATKNAPPSVAPLGALPDLQLEGSPPPANSAASSGWSMDSFEPLDLEPLSLNDDDDDSKESFQPIQLPQAEPSAPALSLGSTLGASLSLTNDDDEDADADQWANRSLDKYRLPPLKPDESLAVDDMTPDFAADHANPMAFDKTDKIDKTDKTEVIPPISKSAAKSTAKPINSIDDVPQFTLSDDDADHTAGLEIERVEQKEKARPEIVKELLRDPDFSYGDETVRQTAAASKKPTVPPADRYDRNSSRAEAAIDLSSAGQPASKGSGNSDMLEDMVRDQVAPQLEKVIEKIVAQLLPQIAERIIKRELERLLEES